MASNIDSNLPVSSDEIHCGTTNPSEGGEVNKGPTVPDQIGVESEEDFSKKTWKEDLTLSVEGKHIYVNSGMLAYASPVFSSLFESAFNNEGPRSIEITGKVYGEFIEFLRCIYPVVMKEVTIDNVMTVLPLACEYKVRNLIDNCEQTLINDFQENKSPDVICRYLAEANTYNLGRLFDKCMQLATQTSRSEITLAEREFPLPPNVRYELQERQFEELERKIEHINSKLLQSRTNCNDLEDLVRSLWIGDSKSSEMPQSQIGKVVVVVLKESTADHCKGRQSITINGKIITVFATYHYDIVQLRNTIKFSINCQPKENLYEWSSKIFAKLRILKHDKTEEHICCQESFIFKEDSKEHVLLDIDKSEIFPFDFNYSSQRREVCCEIYLLVDSTVHKDKKSQSA